MTSFRVFPIRRVDTPRYTLHPMELAEYVDFPILRVYWIVCPQAPTGAHCHREEQELFFLIQGSATAELDAGKGLQDIPLNAGAEAILIGNYVWHHFKNFSSDAILVALSSTTYRPDRSDYIEDYDAFKRARATLRI